VVIVNMILAEYTLVTPLTACVSSSVLWWFIIFIIAIAQNNLAGK